MTKTREIHLAARPHGEPTEGDFDLVEAGLADPEAGQILVRNTVMSVDPYMRGRMNDAQSYVPPFAVGAPLDGGAVGEVVASASEDIGVGTYVLHGLGWREHALLDARKARVVDVGAAPDSAYLGILGLTGLTAYAGLVAIAQLAEGDTVFVSGAAGAVGSAAGQMARLLGAGRVVGSAGSEAKVAYVRDELGFDAAFDYHDGAVAGLLAETAPDGVDVYFDNVGGEHLEAAISRLTVRGRIVLCGAISAYNATEPPPGPRNLMQLVGKRGRMQGFIVGDHEDLRAEFTERVTGWLGDETLTYRETTVEGLDHAVEAFRGVLSGANTGKMVVRL